MFRRKIDNILRAEKLLRVEPKVFNKTLRLLLISILTIGLFYLIAISSDVKLIFMFIGIYSVLVVKLLGKDATPLIFTGKGIVKSPYLAEYWRDIEKYYWEEFAKFKKAPFAPEANPISLYLIKRWTDHNMLAHYGIFFNEEQIKKAEELFKKYGISKIDKE